MLHISHLKKKDLVQVMVGKDKGKTGRILRLIPDKGKLVVEKLNMVKRHSKPAGKQPGGIIEKEAPVAISNVLLYCEKCSKGVRTVKKTLDGGKRARFCKKCDSKLDK